MGRTRKLYGLKLHGRSRITNGSDLLPSVDGRSIWSRRFRDLIGAFGSDLGGERGNLSEGQKALVRRAAALAVELERQEVKFANAGGALTWEIEAYGRATNTLRRVLESLDIHRGRHARDVTPDLKTYLRTKRYGDDGDAEEALA